MVKKAVSEAAASEEARHTVSRYVELRSDARTKLADFFNILAPDDLAIFHANDAVGLGGQLVVVSDDDEGRAAGFIQLPQ